MIDIKSKSEIIIPFDKIGNENWAEKTDQIISEFTSNWNNELPEPESPESIFNLEEKIGTQLPHSLTLFYLKFGTPDIGESLLKFNNIDRIKKVWPGIAAHEPQLSTEEKKLLPQLIVFSDYLGNGNVFCFHAETKEIYYFDHDTPPHLTKLFNDASDYLKACLISCQADLYNLEVGQEQVEVWCEEILIEMFGKEIVKKWKY